MVLRQLQIFRAKGFGEGKEVGEGRKAQVIITERRRGWSS